MKNTARYLTLLALGAAMLASCDYLEPYDNGSYNEENYMNYPTIIRGFVDKAYSLRPDSYYVAEFIGLDAASDDAVYRDPEASWRKFSTGSATMSSNPVSSVWTRDYQAIYYCNLFLEDNVGLNTHYLVDPESDAALKLSLQGDAYALRAWYHYDLLKVFGGVASDGSLLGVPCFTTPTKSEEIDNNAIVRASYDDTVARILEDCDSALVYIPYNNRDYPGDKVYITPVIGSVRYRCMDQVSVWGLKAMTYLLWASPAYCSDASKAQERYAKAAEFAAKVLRHKLDVESKLGFDPKKNYSWNDANNMDVVYCSNAGAQGYNANLMPHAYQGTCTIVPTQNLVDAFPMANGYPISDSRSGYNPAKPYEGRDPRFEAAIFHDGSQLRRDNTGDVMYTFDCAGVDAPNQTETSPTSYYQRKYLYPGYNPFDASVSKGYRFIAMERWEQMCLIFAEAACKSVGPTTAIDGITAREALAYVRSRTNIFGTPGIGADGNDPYLDECAASADKFYELVKNEWRVCTCFEGKRYYNLRRWSNGDADLSAINNVPVYGALVTGSGTAKTYNLSNEVVTLKYPSLYNPIPYTEVRRCPNLLQNKGWETWK